MLEYRNMEDDKNQENTKQNKLITKHQFYFDTPLYEFISLDEIEKNFMSGDVDGYNSISGFDTTFTIDSAPLGDNNWNVFYGFRGIKLTCKRKGNDVIRFLVIKGQDFVMKAGQYPSLADIQFAEIGKKYDKILDQTSLFEFKRAIGLAAHGTGVGSFVYLRRIFEKLIFQTFDNNKHALGVEEKDFNLKRMEDKVGLLKGYLPSQLVEMKSIYSILSKGIHELTEEECLAYFGPMKLSIELILDQKIEMDLKEKRDKKVKEEIQNIHQKLGNK